MTLGEWTFSYGQNHFIEGPFNNSSYWYYKLDGRVDSEEQFELEQDALTALSLTFIYMNEQCIATRTTLPGHLCDRSINIVKPDVISSDEWLWSNGETGTPTYSVISSKWYVEDPSFTYDGPVEGLSTDTELAFLSTETKVFWYVSFDFETYQFTISVDNDII